MSTRDTQVTLLEADGFTGSYNDMVRDSLLTATGLTSGHIQDLYNQLIVDNGATSEFDYLVFLGGSSGSIQDMERELADAGTNIYNPDMPYNDLFSDTAGTEIGAHTTDSNHTYTQNDWSGVIEIVAGQASEGIFIQEPQNIATAPNGVIDGVTYAEGDEWHMLIDRASTATTAQSMAGFIFNQDGATTTQDFKFIGYLRNPAGSGNTNRHMNIVNGGFSGVTDAVMGDIVGATELMIIIKAGDLADMYFDGDLRVSNIDLSPAGIAFNGKIGITYQRSSAGGVPIHPTRAWLVRA